MKRFILNAPNNEAISVARAKLAELTAGHRSLLYRPALPRWIYYRGIAASTSASQKDRAPRLCPSYQPWFILAALVLILAITAGDAMACPMCKAALGSHDGRHGDLVGGFFWSILFMLSMPFLIFGSLTTYMYVLVRRARRADAERKTAAADETFADIVANEHLAEPVSSERL